MTPQEVKLWVHLRSWKKRGFHFRRQAPRDDFIIDFVCLKHRLIVELDGGQHNFDAHARRDAKRDDHFARQGFRVLRFWNNEVDRNLDGVLTLIDDALHNPHPASLRSATLPLRGRDEEARCANVRRKMANTRSPCRRRRRGHGR
ncbi:MAG: endonuclease domain-containing protein [Xanthobacteraceae bacterium]